MSEVKRIDLWALPAEPEVVGPCGWEEAGLVQRGENLYRMEDVEKDVTPRLTPGRIDELLDENMKHKEALRQHMRARLLVLR